MNPSFMDTSQECDVLDNIISKVQVATQYRIYMKAVIASDLAGGHA